MPLLWIPTLLDELRAYLIFAVRLVGEHWIIIAQDESDLCHGVRVISAYPEIARRFSSASSSRTRRLSRSTGDGARARLVDLNSEASRLRNRESSATIAGMIM
jgi:hypothetical protein